MTIRRMRFLASRRHPASVTTILRPFGIDAGYPATNGHGLQGCKVGTAARQVGRQERPLPYRAARLRMLSLDTQCRDSRCIINGMVWIAVGGLAVLGAVALLVVIARRNRDPSGDRDLGDISSSWLNEHRAHERESNHNR